jgi:hypothetical protein
VIGLTLANLLSAIFLRRVWNRNRFVTPAEPGKFYSNIVGSILVLGIAALIIAGSTAQKDVELNIPSVSH